MGKELPGYLGLSVVGRVYNLISRRYLILKRAFDWFAEG